MKEQQIDTLKMDEYEQLEQLLQEAAFSCSSFLDVIENFAAEHGYEPVSLVETALHMVYVIGLDNSY